MKLSTKRSAPRRSLGQELAAISTLALALACGTEPLVEAAPEAPSPYDAPAAGVRGGHLRGEIGPAQVDGAAAPLSAYASMSTLRVVGISQGEEHIAMLQVTLRTDEVELVPGVRERFSADDAGRLVLLGCAGQEVDVWDEFDRPADEVILEVEPEPAGRPGDVTVRLTGQWAEGALSGAPSALATFSFVLVR